MQFLQVGLALSADWMRPVRRKPKIILTIGQVNSRLATERMVPTSARRPLTLTDSVVLPQHTAGAASIHDLFKQDQRDEKVDFDALAPWEQRKVDATEQMQNSGIQKTTRSI